MDKKDFSEWAIVELFGHKRMAGRISDQEIGGCSFVRIDVPETVKSPAWTKLLGQGSIYGITITDEQTARICADNFTPDPMDRWTIEGMISKLPAPHKGNISAGPGEAFTPYDEEDTDED